MGTTTTRDGKPLACWHAAHYEPDGLPKCLGDECEGYVTACGQGFTDCERHAGRQHVDYDLIDDGPLHFDGSTTAGDPITRGCEGCNAEPGEPCRESCLSHERELETELRAGDLVEATISSTHPRTIRLRIDRTPWPGGPGNTVLSDGRAVYAVRTDSIRVVDRSA